MKNIMLDKKQMLMYSLADISNSACFRLVFKKGKKFCRNSPMPRKKEESSLKVFSGSKE
ncbi:hypothetical protein KY360_06380 [Candidatus Woesearchaeota archaeon]|nr:hypothetical protein [Candidatus Woesearchaeota archaeon]